MEIPVEVQITITIIIITIMRNPYGEDMKGG